MKYPRLTFISICLLALALAAGCGTSGNAAAGGNAGAGGSAGSRGAPDFAESGSVAAFEQLPFVSNERLGMFNYIHSISVTPPDAINSEDWGPDIPFGVAAGSGAPGGDVNMHRYTIAFTGYGVSMLAEYTPAYRERYLETMDGMIQKLLNPLVWDYWLRGDEYGFDWGGDNPIHPYNIMYTAHLQLMMAFYERQAGDGKYIDNDVKLTTEDGSQTWTTNLADLSRDIYQQSLANKDSNGDNFYSVSCESPWVFTCCNTIAQLAFAILPDSIDLDAATANTSFVEWHGDHMLDPETSYFYNRYKPYEAVPEYDTKLPGAYSSWAHHFMHGFAPEFVEEHYPAFIANAVEMVEPGTGIVSFGTNRGGDFEGLTLVDLIGTGYAAVLTREMGDADNYALLRKGFDAVAGERIWVGSHYGYLNRSEWPVFMVFPNGFSLWAEATDADNNFRSVVEDPRGPDFYAQPFVAEVSNRDAFVNQAVWDDPVLYVTVNGAAVTTDTTDLVVRNLDENGAYRVYIGEDVYTDWTHSGAELSITTPALSSDLLNIRVVEAR
jgi:hypothetical protein